MVFLCSTIVAGTFVYESYQLLNLRQIIYEFALNYLIIFILRVIS